MNQINISYNLNSDEVIRQVEDMSKRMTDITRMSNQEQIKLMTDVYAQMTSVLDAYMDRVKLQFSSYIDIAKNAWSLASSDSKEYFDSVMKNIDDMVQKNKESADTTVSINKDAIQKKMRDSKEEFEEEIKQVDRRIEKEKQLFNERSIMKGTNAVTSTISEAGGLGGSMTGSLLNMGGNLVGGGLNILTGLNAGQGVKDITSVLIEGLGMLIKSTKDVDEVKRQVISSFGSRGEDMTSIYGGNLTMDNSNSLLKRLYNTQAKFKDTPEFSTSSQMQLNQQYQGSRQFGDIDYHDLGVETTMIGKSRNMGGSEVAQLFIELKQKLNEPIDNLTGRFFQLDNISKDLGINLRDVIRDYQQLIRDNQKYGYSQEQVMGIYSSFGEEIKKGTVSVSQLSEFMKGISGMGTDKSVGLAQLLTQNPEGMLANFKGDKENANKILSVLNQAMSGGDELGAGQILRMINNPNADYSQDKNLSGILNQYGLTGGDLKKLNPDMEKMIMAQSQSFGAESGSFGSSRLIYEKMMGMMGMNLSDNLTDSMYQQKGYDSVGTTSGVMSLNNATRQGQNVVNNQSQILQDIKPWISEMNETIESAFRTISANVEEDYKKNKNLGDAIIKGLATASNEANKIASMFDPERKWTNKLDMSGSKFDGAVDKFSSTVDKIMSINDWIDNIGFMKGKGGFDENEPGVNNWSEVSGSLKDSSVIEKLTKATMNR